MGKRHRWFFRWRAFQIGADKKALQVTIDLLNSKKQGIFTRLQ